jgi:hypothetical protein
MAQRFCEVCSDPMPLEAEGTLCESCVEAVDAQLAEIAEEIECETPAPSAAAPSSSVTPDEMVVAEDKSTSGSFDALDATVATGSGNLDLSMMTQPDVKRKPKPTLPCESCGELQEGLNSFKHPAARESIELCDKCFEAEKATLEHPDDAMQGKVVHPDEAAREEVISMDQEDAELYNKEVLISMESPIEEVYARISLLEGKLQRAKLLLKASKTTLFMRIEHMKKDEREAEYKRLNEIDAKKRSRRSVAKGDASPGAPRKASTSRAPKRTKAQVFRENMTANGFDAAWIDAQIKKLGLE